jgi:hypothetical protein
VVDDYETCQYQQVVCLEVDSSFKIVCKPVNANSLMLNYLFLLQQAIFIRENLFLP